MFDIIAAIIKVASIVRIVVMRIHQTLSNLGFHGCTMLQPSPDVKPKSLQCCHIDCVGGAAQTQTTFQQLLA